jgi:hypothetical protein
MVFDYQCQTISPCKLNDSPTNILLFIRSGRVSLDDPLAWGILPFKNFLSERTTRWALGASDIIFTNP